MFHSFQQTNLRKSQRAILSLLLLGVLLLDIGTKAAIAAAPTRSSASTVSPAYAGEKYSPVSQSDEKPDRIPTVVSPEQGSAVSTATAADLAAALDLPAALLLNASLGTSDPIGTHVFDSPVSGFPTQGNSFAVLSSGDATQTTLPNNDGGLSTQLGGLNNSQGNDLVQLTLTLNVPPGATFWAVDWKFFSEEFPEYVGSNFNDAFFIETPTTAISITGNTITSPNNVAFDPSGNPVTINTTGAVGMTLANATGTTYDGATTTLVSAAAIPAGTAQLTIIFSVTDLGDSVLDTTIFLDNFRFVNTVPPELFPNLLKIPVRWCALGVDDDNNGTIDRGAPSIVDPSVVGESTAKDVLWRRHERVSDNIYIPQANVTFRSGATASAPAFPIIPDPRYVADGSDGQYGDVVHDGAAGDTSEFSTIINACRAAWEALDPSVTGVTAVHINRFVNTDGTPNGIKGMGGRPSFGNGPSQMLAGRAMVVDNLYTLPGPQRIFSQEDIHDELLGHEFGHALTLYHGDGVDQDNDGDLDEPGESNIAGEDGDAPCCGSNLMQYQSGGALGIDLTAAQVDRLRQQTLLHIPDREIEAGSATAIVAAQTPIDPVPADFTVDAVGDVASNSAFVDLDTFGITLDEQSGVAIFLLSTYGPLPSDIAAVNYYFFGDLDNDASTGGTPSAIGFPSNAPGIDFIGHVQVAVTAGNAQAATTVYLFQNGAYTLLDDPGIQARVQTDLVHAEQEPPFNQPDEQAVGSIIELEIPSQLLGTVGTTILLDVVTDDPTSGATDTGPGDLSFNPPTYPTCQVAPTTAQPGDLVTIQVTDMPANVSIHALLGADEIVDGEVTDATGNSSLSFTVPEFTGPSQGRLITVGVDDAQTAITADCSLVVSHAPTFDTPPTPPEGDEFFIEVDAAVGFDVQATDVDAEDTVELTLIGLPAGADFTTTVGNPATATFSWTPTISQQGVHVLTLTAVDDHGITTPVRQLVIAVTSNEPLTYSPFGAVTIDGEDVGAATVTASCDGVTYGPADTQIDGGQLIYFNLDIPGDDPSTAEVEGCADGSTVTFFVNGQQTDQTGTWIQGAAPRIDLNLVTETDTVMVVLPGDANGAPNSRVTIPVQIPNTIDGVEIIAYSFQLTFDPSVLSLPANPSETYDTIGTMSDGWSLTPNTGTPGELRIAGFNTTPLSGSGTLLNLVFDVVGPANSVTALTWNDFLFNEGIPGVHMTDGFFTVLSWTLAGQVFYQDRANRAMSDVTLDLSGDTTAQVTTDASGYSFTLETTGAHTLTPSYNGPVNGISAFDAAFIAQCVAGLRNSADCPLLAADTSGNSALSAFDAALIAQYAAGLAGPTSRVGTWIFAPTERSYTTIESDLLAEDFGAYLVGEVTGNWSAPLPSAAAATAESVAGNGEATSSHTQLLPFVVNSE